MTDEYPGGLTEGGEDFTLHAGDAVLAQRYAETGGKTPDASPERLARLRAFAESLKDLRGKE